jgi:hypothetical protein
MPRRTKRKSTFIFQSLRNNQFKSVLKHVSKPTKTSPRTDDDDGEAFTIMAEMWPSNADNRLAQPYTRSDGVVVEVQVSPYARDRIELTELHNNPRSQYSPMIPVCRLWACPCRCHTRSRP